MADDKELLIDMGVPSTTPSIIKVIGVGGGGGNAVNHMYREGIHDVNFVVCNTDRKALADSPVPVRLQLGKEGLGAGNRPGRAREAAEESLEEIHKMLDDGTKMVFITAGMGGGTGTGAAPVIAREAKKMGILTVGIVTPSASKASRKLTRHSTASRRSPNTWMHSWSSTTRDFEKSIPTSMSFLPLKWQTTR